MNFIYFIKKTIIYFLFIFFLSSNAYSISFEYSRADIEFIKKEFDYFSKINKNSLQDFEKINSMVFCYTTFLELYKNKEMLNPEEQEYLNRFFTYNSMKGFNDVMTAQIINEYEDNDFDKASKIFNKILFDYDLSKNIISDWILDKSKEDISATLFDFNILVCRNQYDKYFIETLQDAMNKNE